MPQYFPLAAITDEFSPDLETAVRSMAEVGMVAAELRMVFGKNIIDLTDEELNQAKRIVEAQGMRVISIASPLLKCVLPDAPEVDPRFQQDIFAARHTFAGQLVLARRPSRSPGAWGRASSVYSPTGAQSPRSNASTGSWWRCATWRSKPRPRI